MKSTAGQILICVLTADALMGLVAMMLYVIKNM